MRNLTLLLNTMLIANQSPANEPFSGDALNPAFFGATTEHGAGTKTIWVTPDPVERFVTYQPPSVMREGVRIDFPPYTESILLEPPAKEVIVPGGGSIVRNVYESVGIINQGGQIRLCALVRPNVVAVAAHYDNSLYEGGGNWSSYAGMSVRFIGSAASQSAKLTKPAFKAGDFLCYYLDTNITVVAPAVIAPLEPDSAYVGRSVVIFGLSGLTKAAAGTTILKYSFVNGGARTAQASNKPNAPVQIQAGDSGGPCYIFVNGVPRYFGSIATINLTIIQINVASPHIAAIASL
jgi:hypothetical protein